MVVPALPGRQNGCSLCAAAISADHCAASIPLGGAPEIVLTPSNSGKGQKIARCPSCRIALWSHYSGAGDKVKFIRVGTLDEPDLLPPDIHIFTASKQPWVVIPPRALAVEAYYDWREVWPEYAKKRRAAISGG